MQCEPFSLETVQRSGVEPTTMENEIPEPSPAEASATATSDSAYPLAPAVPYPESPTVAPGFARREALWTLGIGIGYLLFWQIVLLIRIDNIVVISITTLLSLAL